MKYTSTLAVVTLLVLSACDSIGVTRTSAQLPPASNERSLPDELLYVDGSEGSTQHPYIEVFNAKDVSNQNPIYTIPPRKGGQWVLFAVDAQNDLYAVNYFRNAAEVDVFASGATKPKFSCVLNALPSDSYIAGNTLYLATSTDTIDEYTLPLTRNGSDCAAPALVLTDRYARLRGIEMISVAVDAHGNIFDSWIAGYSKYKVHIDEFPAGSKEARSYASAGSLNGGFMAFDSKGDIVTSVSHDGKGDNIAVFQAGKRHAAFYDGIPEGVYFAPAFGSHDSVLFMSADYPNPEIRVYAYNPAAGRPGKSLGAFSNIWYGASSIAVYAKL
jgi:hypothetical protein